VALASQATNQGLASAASKTTITLVSSGASDEGDGNFIEFVKLLKQSGLQVNQDVISDDASGLRVLISGKADFDIGDPVETILAATNGGVNIKYLATDQESTDYVILSKPGYTLHNLAGATFGIESPGTSGVTIGDAALEAAGVKLNTIHDVTIGGTSARVTALLAGRIDLAPVLAPAAATAVATGKVKVLLNAGVELGAYLQQGLISNDAYVASHPQVVQTVVNDLIEASRYSATNENGYITEVNGAGLSNGLKTSQEQQIWQTFKQSQFFAVNGGVCPSVITKTLNLNYETGTLTRANTPSQSKWLDTTFVKNFLTTHHQSSSAC
jgi:ABC-type nitrate/sulfonate/bicarbonate transport system substrate-binding protein